MKAYDFNYTWITPVDELGDVGFALEADYDLSFGYKMPWYNENKFLVFQVKPHFKLGGLFHTVFHLYYFRIHSWWDIIGTQFTFMDWKTKMDLVEY